MNTPRLFVNDIGDIFFLNEEGETFCEPYGSFEPERYEAFWQIAKACNSHDALVAALSMAARYASRGEIISTPDLLDIQALIRQVQS